MEKNCPPEGVQNHNLNNTGLVRSTTVPVGLFSPPISWLFGTSNFFPCSAVEDSASPTPRYEGDLLFNPQAGTRVSTTCASGRRVLNPL